MFIKAASLYLNSCETVQKQLKLLNYYCHLKYFYFRVTGIFLCCRTLRLPLKTQTEPHCAAARASVWEWEDENASSPLISELEEHLRQNGD